MNRVMKLSAFLLLLGHLFVGTVFCEEGVIVEEESFKNALRDAIQETDFVKDREITIKIPTSFFKDSRKDATLVIDLGFRGFGGIYKPLGTIKKTDLNFNIKKDIASKENRKLITDFLKSIQNQGQFGTLFLKASILKNSLESGSGIVLSFAGKPAKYGQNDFDNLMAYLFARLAQFTFPYLGDTKNFFEQNEDLKEVVAKISPLIKGVDEELEGKLSTIYGSYKKFSSIKTNPFIAEESTAVGPVIFNVLMAFDKVEAKYKKEAVDDSAAKDLRTITDEYKDAKTNLRDVYKKDPEATKKLELLADKVRTLKVRKKSAVRKYNRLFVEKYSYIDDKTIVALLTVAIAKLKREIKDRTQINQMYNLLAPLYDIGINVKIFFGMIKGAVSTIVQIKQAPRRLMGFFRSKFRGATQAAKAEVTALHEEAAGGVATAKEGVKGEISSVKEEARVAKEEVKGVGTELREEAASVKGEVGEEVGSAKSEFGSAKSELTSELGDAQKDIEEDEE